MALALFDLDDTLIKGNCETSWFEFLIARGHYDGSRFAEQMAEFDRMYHEGGGDITDYMYFVLQPLTQQPMETLIGWREEWFAERGIHMIHRGAQAQLQHHFDADDTVVIISASNQFCVEPFAEHFDVHHHLSSTPEVVNEQFTGIFAGPACFAEHKITHLEGWRQSTSHSLEGSYFYSDSRNDIPLLELVDNPVATHPDAHLTQLATERGWPILSLC